MLSEFDIRQTEKYRLLQEQLANYHPGLGAYGLGAGLLLFFGGIFGRNIGEVDPGLMTGIGLCMSLAGGAYLLHCRFEERRIRQEMRSIQLHFHGKGQRLDFMGDVAPL